MGGLLCRTIYDIVPELQQWRVVFELLLLRPKDVEQLYLAYRKMGKTLDQRLTKPEFFKHIGVGNSPFATQTFALFDADGSGSVDFGGMVLAVWNYCTLQKSSLAEFAFKIYDADDSGTIELEEMRFIVKEMYGVEFENNENAERVQEGIEQWFRQAGDFAEISMQEFFQFTATHATLLLPAHKLQTRLQENLCGMPFWERQTRRRIKSGQRKVMTVMRLFEQTQKQQRENEKKAAEELAKRKIEDEKRRLARDKQRNRLRLPGSGGGGGSDVSAAIAEHQRQGNGRAPVERREPGGRRRPRHSARGVHPGGGSARWMSASESEDDDAQQLPGMAGGDPEEQTQMGETTIVFKRKALAGPRRSTSNDDENFDKYVEYMQRKRKESTSSPGVNSVVSSVVSRRDQDRRGVSGGAAMAARAPRRSRGRASVDHGGGARSRGRASDAGRVARRSDAAPRGAGAGGGGGGGGGGRGARRSTTAMRASRGSRRSSAYAPVR